MVDILTQRFSYASITPFKDYCHISDRKKLTNQFNDLLDLLDEEDSDLFKLKLMSKELQTNKKTGKIYSLPQKKKTKKKTHYFTTNEEIQQRISFDYLYSNKNGSPTFDTTSDRHIKNHYGRAFSEINVTIIERSVRLHGDKLTIKLYVHTKSRHFNCIYFNFYSRIVIGC